MFRERIDDVLGRRVRVCRCHRFLACLAGAAAILGLLFFALHGRGVEAAQNHSASPQLNRKLLPPLCRANAKRGPGIRGLSLAQVFETRPAEGPSVAEYLIRMVPKLMYQGTFLLAALVGIALGLVFWRRGRRAAVVTLIVSLVLLVTSIATSGVYAFISLDLMREIALREARYDVVHIVNESVRGIVVIVLLIAAFIGRKLPTTVPS